jgi:hypothetical protein
MRKYSFLAAALLLSPGPFCLAQRIEVTIPATKPLTGHLILVFAKKPRPQPRFQLSENYLSAEGFGVDVENLKPGTPVVVDAKTFGNPRRSLDDLDAGDYYVQAVFNGGPGMPHCYTGGPAEYTMHENNGTWTQRVLPEMVKHMLATAPKGADTTSWRY